MQDIKLGDVFRELPAPRRRWRVIAERDGTYELGCVEKPSLSRFAQAEKLPNGLSYEPERHSNPPDDGDEAPA